MKDILAGIIGITLGAVGCLVQVAFWGVCVVGGLWIGLKVISWIF